MKVKFNVTNVVYWRAYEAWKERICVFDPSIYGLDWDDYETDEDMVKAYNAIEEERIKELPTTFEFESDVYSLDDYYLDDAIGGYILDEVFYFPKTWDFTYEVI